MKIEHHHFVGDAVTHISAYAPSLNTWDAHCKYNVTCACAYKYFTYTAVHVFRPPFHYIWTQLCHLRHISTKLFNQRDRPCVERGDETENSCLIKPPCGRLIYLGADSLHSAPLIRNQIVQPPASSTKSLEDRGGPQRTREFTKKKVKSILLTKGRGRAHFNHPLKDIACGLGNLPAKKNK